MRKLVSEHLSERGVLSSKSRISKKARRIAYFSMEIGLDPRMPTYSGGLGVLSGDALRSYADLDIPLVGVTLLYKKGYFYQKLNAKGEQIEVPYQWNPRDFLTPLRNRVKIRVKNRDIFIKAWQYVITGINGYRIPVIFLDTDIRGNIDYDRKLSYYLYGGDGEYRFFQEAVLGIGGVRMLSKLGYTGLNRYHMNEGHASLLTLELLNRFKEEENKNSVIEAVRKRCVFTTHTPVPAGHDRFSYDLVSEFFDNDYIPLEFLKEISNGNDLNMTKLALHLSHYINGVGRQHGKVSREMFPGYHVDSISNGVHSASWVSSGFKRLYDKYILGWQNDPSSLRYALSIPRREVWEAHVNAKAKLLDFVLNKRDIKLDENVLTIGFARRATAYKRAELVFFDTERLVKIAEKVGKIQLIFSGKAHPKDLPGKESIKKLISVSKELQDKIKVVYLKNYDMGLAKMLVSGVDLWLNTPRKPKEASGTSGMKAAHNGVPNLSILDGWWIEGCIEGVTGWSVGKAKTTESIDKDDADSLYTKLEKLIVPLFYNKRKVWIDIMRSSIAINASFFNTHRMVQQYVLNAYFK